MPFEKIKPITAETKNSILLIETTIENNRIFFTLLCKKCGAKEPLAWFALKNENKDMIKGFLNDWLSKGAKFITFYTEKFTG